MLQPKTTTPTRNTATDVPAGLNATELRRRLPELVEAYASAKDHAEALRDALKAVAEKHGIAPAVLRKFVASAADSERREKLVAQAEQMSLLLDLDE